MLPLPWVGKVPQMPELLAALSCARLDRLQRAGAMSAVHHTGSGSVERVQHNRRQHHLMSRDRRHARGMALRWQSCAIEVATGTGLTC